MLTPFKDVPMGSEFLFQDFKDGLKDSCFKVQINGLEAFIYSNKENPAYSFCLPETEVFC